MSPALVAATTHGGGPAHSRRVLNWFVLFPKKPTEGDAQLAHKPEPKQRWQSGRISSQDRAVFFRTLAALFEAGLPLTQSLECLAKQSGSAPLSLAARRMSVRVASGAPLSRALAESAHAFGLDHAKLIHTGEQTGRLAAILRKLADSEERRMQQALKLRSALVTPIVVSLVCLVMVLVGPPLILRGLLDSLVENGADLPWATRLLITASDLLRTPWTYVLLLAIGACLLWGTKRWGRQPSAQLAGEAVLLQLPLLGPARQLVLLISVTDTLATSLDAGLPLLQAVELAGQVTASPWVEAELKQVQDRLREGDSLRRAFAISPLFNGIFLQSLETGVQSGHLPGLLASCRRLLRDSLQQKLEMLTGAIEPLVLLTVGGVVGFVVLATMLPMIKLLETL